MKSLVEYINEMSLEQLDDYITKTLKISYDDVQKILSDKNLDDKFKNEVNTFINRKFDNNNIVNRILFSVINELNDNNKQVFFNTLSELNNDKSTIYGFLDINNIFPGTEIFNSSDILNIFNNILSIPELNNIDDNNFKNMLIDLSNTTLPGGTASGPYEALLKVFINGKVTSKKGDVNMAMQDNKTLHIEVKLCKGCNFSPYNKNGIIISDNNVSDILNSKNKQDDLIELIKQYINKEDLCIDKFVELFFKNKSFDENSIKSCIGTYLLHSYLINQFNNDATNEYLILFTSSTSRKKCGNYIWINVNEYKNKFYNSNNDKQFNDKLLLELINFSDTNLEFRRIHRNTVEAYFTK